MNSVNELDVSLDGHPFSDVLGYRFISPQLFYFTGDPSMQAFDPCITGSLQPSIVEAERDVVRGRLANTAERGDRADELLEADASVEPDLIFRDGAREGTYG